jgi:hypothetical protein
MRQSTWIGATITINTAPFNAGYGTPPRFGLDLAGNLAITIIYELGRAVARLYGGDASRIVEDGPDEDPDGSRSRANSQLIFDECFR